MVALKLKNGPGYLSIPKKPKRTSSVKGTSFTVMLELSKFILCAINSSIDILFATGEGESLGIQIAGLTDDRDEYGIFISEIMADSSAEKCKLLQ